MIFDDLPSEIRKLTLRYRIGFAYIWVSFLLINMATVKFELSRSVEDMMVGFQIYSSLVSLVFAMIAKRKRNGLDVDNTDFNTITFYREAYEGVPIATVALERLNAQGRKITKFEARKYAQKSKN